MKNMLENIFKSMFDMTTAVGQVNCMMIFLAVSSLLLLRSIDKEAEKAHRLNGKTP